MNKKQTIFATLFVILLLSTVMIAIANAAIAAKPAPAPALLDPKTIPKYVNQLVANIPVYAPTHVTDANGNPEDDYTINMISFDENILPPGTPLINPVLDPTTQLPLTHVWGYNGSAYDATATAPTAFKFFNSPSATFIAQRGVASKVTWTNNITEPEFLPVDPTIMWADPTNPQPAMPRMYLGTYPTFQGTATTFTATSATASYQVQTQIPAPLVPHLHGAEVQSYSDGGPNAWFTYDGKHGTSYSTNATTDANAAVYYYPNGQNPGTQWYHDHAMGMTRLNVMSGLAGFYLLKDPNTTAITTPAANGADFDQYLNQHFKYGVNEIPIAIQDRSFYANGSLWFPTVGLNPTIHPYWMPEFFGNTIMVNGKVWPNLNVTQGAYRFRALDGSNARFYTLSFSNKMPFTVIGSDGGYLQQKAVVTSLTIAPGERYDIIVDFTAVPVGTKVILTNDAKAPFPNGATADPQTTGQIMQFTVAGTTAAPGTAKDNVGATTPNLPAGLNPTIPVGAFPNLAAAPATQATPNRTRTLFEVMGPAGPVMVTVNGQLFSGDLSETPSVGTTEDWVIVNLTGDTHPIHTHLATFQLVSRQPFQAAKYTKDWLALQIDPITKMPAMPPFRPGFVPFELNPTPYFQGKATTALPTEMGWKDTVQMNPGEVTTIRIRWAPNDQIGVTNYPFDPTQGPGYVWHCHIVDHEDNEMMRPYTVLP